jgi:outer membrane receptor protein involved in Fe transport
MVGAFHGVASAARASEADEAFEPVVVTATRLPVDANRLAAMITRVSGEELNRRGAEDLRATLSLVSGSEAPPGGDAGPASAVPSFWGLHEFDAFLLVVDGVPWGGAFNPAVATLDLHNIDRVEVLKGPSPVALGQNAFVGVIQVIHAPAGEARPVLSLAGGEHGSFEGAFTVNLPKTAGFAQTLSASGESQGFSDRFEKVRDFKGAYRAERGFAGGVLQLDLDLAVRRDRPQSPTVLEGGALTSKTPLNANYNPADGRIDADSLHGQARYERATPLGQWTTLASLAYSETTDIRGFLRSDLVDDGSANADSQNQRRRVLDAYADSHLSFTGPFGAKMLAGFDVLAGFGRQISRNGEY